MGMTNRQLQAWLRTMIKLIESRIELNQGNEAVQAELKTLLELFQSMLEDGTD